MTPDRPLWILEPGPEAIGGGWRFAIRLAKGIDREVVIACPANSPAAHAAETAQIRRFNLSFPKPSVRHAAALANCALALRQGVPPEAVVVSGAIRASLVTALARLPNPVVHLMHEQDSAARSSVRLALSRSTSIVAVGQRSAEAYSRALPGATVREVNNFLLPGEVEELAVARASRAGAAPGSPPVLAVVARLIPEKGVDVLIDELATIADSFSRVSIAGDHQDASHASEIRRRITTHGLSKRIQLLGPRTDIPAVLGDADALVVPSIGNEGQPTVILEGLAAGLPVVARSPLVGTEFAGLPVIPYESPSSLAAALHRLPSEPVDRRVFEHRFGVHQVIAQIDAAAFQTRGG